MKKKKILIVGGDPNSINSEIILKCWRKISKSLRKRIYIISSYDLIKQQLKKLNYSDQIIFMPSFQTFINRLKRSKNDYREYVEGILEDYIIDDDRQLSIYKINAENWFYNVKSMHAISKEFGAKYYVFLQPTMGIIPTHIPTDKNSNDYEIYSKYCNCQF